MRQPARRSGERYENDAADSQGDGHELQRRNRLTENQRRKRQHEDRGGLIQDRRGGRLREVRVVQETSEQNPSVKLTQAQWEKNAMEQEKSPVNDEEFTVNTDQIQIDYDHNK